MGGGVAGLAVMLPAVGGSDNADSAAAVLSICRVRALREASGPGPAPLLHNMLSLASS